MKSFTPAIYNLPSPIGFDAEVYSIQLQLARLQWMQVIFGVAHIQRRDQEGGKSMMYPQGRMNGIDIDLTFDSSYASRTFFLTEDNIDISPKTDKWNWVSENVEIAQPFSIIIHCNLQSLGTDSYERLKTDVLYVLNNCPKVSGVMMYEDMKNVWKDFTITDKLNGVTRYPNYCLRFDGICTYLAFPYNGEIKYNPETGTPIRSIIGWKVCQVICHVVDSPNPANTQLLGNGDRIPIEYTADINGNVLMPYLVSVHGITVLSRFMLNQEYYQGTFFRNGVLNTSPNGNLGSGDFLNFDASLPVWSE